MMAWNNGITEGFWDETSGRLYTTGQPFGPAAEEALIERVSGRVLVVCCGTGRSIRKLLDRRVDAYGIDGAAERIDLARQNLAYAGFDPRRVAVADLASLPFPDHSFDYVVAAGCIGPSPDPRPALRDMARVCRAEIRLLEPLEKSGFHIGRVLARLADGHAPISHAALVSLNLDYRVEWETTMGLLAYIRIIKGRNF